MCFLRFCHNKTASKRSKLIEFWRFSIFPYVSQVNVWISACAYSSNDVVIIFALLLSNHQHMWMWMADPFRAAVLLLHTASLPFSLSPLLSFREEYHRLLASLRARSNYSNRFYDAYTLHLYGVRVERAQASYWRWLTTPKIQTTHAWMRFAGLMMQPQRIIGI